MNVPRFRHGRDHRTRKTTAHRFLLCRVLAIGVCGLAAGLAGVQRSAASEPPLWADAAIESRLPPRNYTGIPVEELSRKYGELPKPATGRWAYAYPSYGIPVFLAYSYGYPAHRPYSYYYRPWYSFPPAYRTYRPWYTYPPAYWRYRPGNRYRPDPYRRLNRYDDWRFDRFRNTTPNFGLGYPYTY